MKFIADLHIHSHYSRATSKNLIPEFLDYWARIKGLTVVGTGDFTHPGWLMELKEKLEPAEQGLFKLKKEFQQNHKTHSPLLGRNPVRFILTAEISTIYKKNEKVRKVHQVIFAPDFQTVETIQQELTKREVNITSDGRPIIGMDSRNLLEIVLKASDNTFFVPAHIWTPWFSALGARSGFDSISDCYGDLTGHIHAVETGLSSDPPMNWMCSFLDSFTLISNSDAHSPEKLGREANLFDTRLSYDSIIQAIQNKDKPHFLGTIEFFPQEGKYHYDGHRKCGVCLNPRETANNNGLCPICGKQVTVGVLNRVMQLSDRNHPPDSSKNPAFYSLIPLKEILAEIAGVGPQSKQVSQNYHLMIQKLGSEFDILLNIPVETISDLANERIAEAIKRMRNGDVFVREGFDGEFGRITVFHKNEFSNASCQKPLFKELPSTPSIQKKNTQSHKKKTAKSSPLPDSKHIQKKIHSDIPNGFTEFKPRIESKTLNPEQKRAVEHFKGPALIIAGPGTGKTRVLAFRIAHLLQEKKIKPDNILAVTFTNKSALEMKNRLSRLPGSSSSLDQPWISTFHGLGYSILRKYSEKYGRDDCFSIIDEDEKNQILLKRVKCESKQLKRISASITRIKQNLLSETKIADGDGKNIFLQYESVLESLNAFDLDDLISKPVTLLAEFPEIRDDYRSKIKWCLVDEYQDINFAQYQLLQHILPGPDPNYVVIGDPNQAIYGFRGSDVRFITRFKHDYPRASEYILKQSYRCSDHILQASGDIILSLSNTEKNLQGLHEGVKINIIQNSTDKSEAEFMARTIEQMIGGLGFFSMDSQVTEGNEVSEIQSLSDFAVLCRINQQMEVMKKAFQNHLIPFQTVGDTPFLKTEPAKSIIQLIKWLKNPKYSFSENKLIDPNRIQPSSSAPIKFTIDNDYPVTEIITKIHDNFIRDQFRNDQMVEKLLDVACKFDNQLEAFLKFVSLGTSMDLYRADIEQVSLMTLHAAKGLEFNCVFIIGCESGLIPYSLFLKTEPDMEEERRLLYVGMTRAKNFLYLSHAKKRTLHGKIYNLPRSPFLDDIEKKLLEVTQSKTKKKKNQNGSQLKLFDF